MDPTSVPEPPTQIFAGPVLLVYMLNWGLHGVLTVQMYNYYISFPMDIFWCQCLVYGVYLLETTQTLIMTHDAFATFAVGFGDPREIGEIRLTWFTVPVVGGVVGLVTKTFYAFRITVLAQSYISGGLVSLIALISSAAAITSGLLIRVAGSLQKLPEDEGIFAATGIWLAGSALSDVLIASFMTYFLVRRDTGLKNTRLLINKILRVTIETNATTAIIAVVALGVFLGRKHDDFHVTPSSALTKLYANTLLAIFNDRMRIIGGRFTIDTELDEPIDSFIWRNPLTFTTAATGDRMKRTLSFQARPGVCSSDDTTPGSPNNLAEHTGAVDGIALDLIPSNGKGKRLDMELGSTSTEDHRNSIKRTSAL